MGVALIIVSEYKELPKVSYQTVQRGKKLAMRRRERNSLNECRYCRPDKAMGSLPHATRLQIPHSRPYRTFSLPVLRGALIDPKCVWAGATANFTVNPREKLRQAMVLVAVAVAYFVTGRLTQAVVPGHNLGSPIWPPTGLAIAALLLLDYWIWPGLLLGALATMLTTLPANPAATLSRVAAGVGIAAAMTL